jgi:hypothetical protein
MSGKLTLCAENILKYARPGLYRHFDASGRLLYIGETENFWARSMDHLRLARWRHKIHALELEPMSKAEAKELEPKAIAAELPLYNRTNHPENECKSKATLTFERATLTLEREKTRKIERPSSAARRSIPGVTSLESLVRRKEAIERFAIGAKEFDVEIRPHLIEVPLGPRAIAFTASSIERQLAARQSAAESAERRKEWELWLKSEGLPIPTDGERWGDWEEWFKSKGRLPMPK